MRVPHTLLRVLGRATPLAPALRPSRLLWGATAGTCSWFAYHQIPTLEAKCNSGTMAEARPEEQGAPKKAGPPTAAASPSHLIDSDEFASFRQELEELDGKREVMIKRSREILKASKAAIFALHRGDIAGAEGQLESAAAVARELLPLAETSPTLRGGSLSASLEEYAEARAFLRFLQHGDVATKASMEFVNTTEYLGGVVDMTGELVRYAVLKATNFDKSAVEQVRDLMDQLMGELLLFDFRNSPLRKKYDAVKYNLKKIESVLYDLTMHGHLPLADPSEPPQPAPAAPSGEGEQ